MDKQLFDSLDYQNDSHWVAKEFFNSIYQQDSFLWALPLLVQKKGCSVNEEYCFFPDPNDPDPASHFSGAMFGTMGEEVIVSDQQYESYLTEACNKFLENHPEFQVRVNAILAKPI